MQNWLFQVILSHFGGKRGLFSHFSQLSSLRWLGQSSEVECNPKLSISFFDDLGGLFLHFSQLSSLSQSLEVEHNPKMSISFFDDVGGLFHILVDFHHLDHSTDHQKLNIIQKPTFHFLKIFFNPWGEGYIG